MKDLRLSALGGPNASLTEWSMLYQGQVVNQVEEKQLSMSLCAYHYIPITHKQASASRRDALDTI